MMESDSSRSDFSDNLSLCMSVEDCSFEEPDEVIQEEENTYGNAPYRFEPYAADAGDEEENGDEDSEVSEDGASRGV